MKHQPITKQNYDFLRLSSPIHTTQSHTFLPLSPSAYSLVPCFMIYSNYYTTVLPPPLPPLTPLLYPRPHPTSLAQLHHSQLPRPPKFTPYPIPLIVPLPAHHSTSHIPP